MSYVSELHLQWKQFGLNGTYCAAQIGCALLWTQKVHFLCMNAPPDSNWQLPFCFCVGVCGGPWHSLAFLPVGGVQKSYLAERQRSGWRCPGGEEAPGWSSAGGERGSAGWSCAPAPWCCPAGVSSPAQRDVCWLTKTDYERHYESWQIDIVEQWLSTGFASGPR